MCHYFPSRIIPIKLGLLAKKIDNNFPFAFHTLFLFNFGLGFEKKIRIGATQKFKKGNQS